MPTDAEIQKVLDEAKRLIEEGYKTFIPREKNIQTLHDLNLKQKDVYNAICNLTIDEWSKGPIKDRGIANSSPLWVFKTKIYDELIYIKFKIDNIENGRILKVISFHINENWPNNFI